MSIDMGLLVRRVLLTELLPDPEPMLASVASAAGASSAPNRW
jgi:hypothetical protein